jgi:predicted RNA-binding Zn-ribbon protein involved in translation (DUF1610 family)
MSEDPKDPVDRLVEAYDRMLRQVHEAAESAEQKSAPWLRETLVTARERAVELGELTREEAERISTYVERDLQDAAQFIAETGQEFRDWVSFDWHLMQDRLLEIFAGMADQTSETLRAFAEQARETRRYRAGDITAAGTFECVACGAQLQLKKTGHIPPCPKCQATAFERRTNVASDGD